MTKYVRYLSGEWSALYVDGVLVRYGDHYLVDEWIASHLGEEEVHNDDFLWADGRTVYETLKEVEKATTAREWRELDALALRSQAAELIRQADELENTK